MTLRPNNGCLWIFLSLYFLNFSIFYMYLIAEFFLKETRISSWNFYLYIFYWSFERRSIVFNFLSGDEIDFVDFLILNNSFSTMFVWGLILIDLRVFILSPFGLINVLIFYLGKYNSKLTETFEGDFYFYTIFYFSWTMLLYLSLFWVAISLSVIELCCYYWQNYTDKF